MTADRAMFVSAGAAKELQQITGVPEHVFRTSLAEMGGKADKLAVFHEFTCGCGATVITGPAEARSGRTLRCSNCRAEHVERALAARRKIAA